ncbi:MAG: LOG family protein [Ignavibacteria bacterium]|nr:LOG family protein [Ignavibacteria bacterium]
MIITIFGNARCVPASEEYETAYELGKELAKHHFTVCNGGYGGIMEASAQGAKAVTGKTIGVVIKSFFSKPNVYLDEIVEKNSLIERMMELIERGDAYIILRGGTGTLLEFAAVWELAHKQIMKEKPIVLLGDFWKPVVQLFENEKSFFNGGTITQYVTEVSSVEACVKLLQEKL